MDYKWKWSNVDQGRLMRAKKTKLVSIDRDKCEAVFKGSAGKEYHTSLEICTCADFAITKGKEPCKHIIRVGLECGCINDGGYTQSEQSNIDNILLKDRLATLYGYYYLHDDPLVSDEEYDKLKMDYILKNGAFKRRSKSKSSNAPIVEQIENSAQSSKPDARSLCEKLIQHFDEEGMEYIDKTANGGALYFFSEAEADSLKEKGYSVEYAEKGTRGTGRRPAWYVRFPK